MSTSILQAVATATSYLPTVTQCAHNVRDCASSFAIQFVANSIGNPFSQNDCSDKEGNQSPAQIVNNIYQNAVSAVLWWFGLNQVGLLGGILPWHAGSSLASEFHKTTLCWANSTFSN